MKYAKMRSINFGDIMGDGVTVICYGKETFFETRKEAEERYLGFMGMCEGSERDRYTEIYLQLKEGCSICTDRVD